MIYFAQVKNGGPIKVGATRDLRARATALGHFNPAGVEILATIRGDTIREAALHWALVPFKMSGEWYPSCAPIWRMILEAIDFGDLLWLPDPGRDMRAAMGAAKERFGTTAEAALALRLTVTAVPALTKAPPTYAMGAFMGRLAMYIAAQNGALPSYLSVEPATGRRAA